eukprot:NODE_588_length_6359_cov_0.522843.p4 type:complete len:243 gc:universal NODE_588_length_6359_cov_0.522843:4076-3348(-)
MHRVLFQRIVGSIGKQKSVVNSILPPQNNAPEERSESNLKSTKVLKKNGIQSLFTDAEETFSTSDNFDKLYGGFTTKRFSNDVSKILTRPLSVEDIELRPDGLLYMPEIRYRRTLNEAFGPGNWKLVPRSAHYKLEVGNAFLLLRDYALICDSTFVSQARGEHDFYSMASLGTAVESVKSNALTRCCKDLGIASELWDPVFISKFKRENTSNVRVSHKNSGRVSNLNLKKGQEVDYPYQKIR